MVLDTYLLHNNIYDCMNLFMISIYFQDAGIMKRLEMVFVINITTMLIAILMVAIVKVSHLNAFESCWMQHLSLESTKSCKAKNLTRILQELNWARI